MATPPPYPPSPPGPPYPPPYPPAYGPRPQSPRNGVGIAALICGVLAIVTVWTLVGGIILGIVSIVLGGIGHSRARKGQATNGGLAIAGIVLGVVALVGAIALIAIGVIWFRNVGGADYIDCVRNAGNDQSAIDRCNDQFRHHIEERYSVTLTPAPTR